MDPNRGPFNHSARVVAGLELGWYSAPPDHTLGHELGGGGQDGAGGAAVAGAGAIGDVGAAVAGAGGAGGAAGPEGAALVQRLRQLLALEVRWCRSTL